MIEELYNFGLTKEQEERAKKLHDDSTVIDMLFQGPIGTYSISDELQEELEKMALEKFPYSAMDRVSYAQDIIDKWYTDGKLRELYRDCWYESGMSAACRQLGVSSRDALLFSMASIQHEFDSFDWLIKATKAEHIEYAKKNNLKAGIVTCQETLGFGKDLSLVEKAYDFGLRVIQLTYNNHNLIGAGCMEDNNAGLSVFGRKFVEKLNELGIVVDTGHCGRQTTLDACKYSKAPVVASHTGVENVYFHNRAKSDEEIKAIADTGGVVGMFCMPWFIAKDPENTTVDDFIDHIDYAVRLVGADHVGIGTDWPMPQTKWMATAFKQYVAPTIGFQPGDGPSTEFVKGLKDYRSFLNITRGLVARGYSDGDISKIMGGNWVRVFKSVWK